MKDGEKPQKRRCAANVFFVFFFLFYPPRSLHRAHNFKENPILFLSTATSDHAIAYITLYYMIAIVVIRTTYNEHWPSAEDMCCRVTRTVTAGRVGK